VEADNDAIPLGQAAKEFQVSEALIYRLLRDGKLTRYRRLGDRRRYVSPRELREQLRPRAEDAR
jgi:transposase